MANGEWAYAPTKKRRMSMVLRLLLTINSNIIDIGAHKCQPNPYNESFLAPKCSKEMENWINIPYYCALWSILCQQVRVNASEKRKVDEVQHSHWIDLRTYTTHGLQYTKQSIMSIRITRPRHNSVRINGIVENH